MVDNLINSQFLPLLLLGLLTWVVLVQQCYYWFLFFRLGRSKRRSESSAARGVSVVICAHNEHHRLSENLPLILGQEQAALEVLVVNHSSDDDTGFLLNHLSGEFPQLTTVNMPEDLNFFSGKKFPLSIGIKSAKHDVVLLTDADCTPASPEWARLMLSGMTPGREIVLGYGAYRHYPGFLNKLIRYDTAAIAIQYLSYALAGVPYMGVGRNLAYRKQIFYRNQGFISHYRIRSGDDDLFINRVANRKNTAVVTDPEAFTLSEPKRTLGEWITQKRRHFSTGHLYKFRHRLLLGTYAVSQPLFYALSILLLALNWSVIPVVLLMLIRFGTQYAVFSSGMKRLREKDLVPLLPLYEILLMFFNAGVYFSNLISKPVKWK